MERITACETGELATREAEAHQGTSPNTAQAATFLLNPPAPPIPTATVEVLTPARTFAGAEPKLSRSVRLLDFSVAVAILLFLLPLMALCALAIRLSSRGPVIYRQARIGRGGREFTCFKFRTMIDCADQSIDSILVQDSCCREEWANRYKLLQDPRVTALGGFMRRYSLDELPQLFNVLKGEMSVVGPRPIVTDEIHKYGDRFTDYCSVNPGLTGLWQVSGRHALSYDQRVRLDAEYANAKSVRLDLLILWKTVPVVLFGQNE
ncbi:MAG: sugar transferase [Pseudomonadota bacterium]|nr:sugar transferase [Pseudomonadota bacterium]